MSSQVVLDEIVYGNTLRVMLRCVLSVYLFETGTNHEIWNCVLECSRILKPLIFKNKK